MSNFSFPKLITQKNNLQIVLDCAVKFYEYWSQSFAETTFNRLAEFKSDLKTVSALFLNDNLDEITQKIYVCRMFYMLNYVDGRKLKRAFRLPNKTKVDEQELKEYVSMRNDALKSWDALRNFVDHVRFFEVYPDTFDFCKKMSCIFI